MLREGKGNSMDDLTKKIIEMRESTPSMKFAEIGKALDISEDAAWRRYRKAKGKKPKAVEPGKTSLSKEYTDTNNLIIVATAKEKDRIKTLEQLLAVAKIDLDVWEVERWVANKWEVAGKFGTKGSESFELQDLWQVKAWLIRKAPVAITPVVQPVTVQIKLLPKKKIKRGILKRAIVFGDLHMGFTRSLRTGILTPFHDRRALDILLQIIEHVKPDQIVCLGDLLDLADWSDKFARSPNMYWTTQPSILECSWWLGQVRLTAPRDTRIGTIEGNHDERMPRNIIEHMKEGYGLRSVDEMQLPPINTIPRLLALHDLGITWHGDYPNGEVWIGEDIACEHGQNTRAKSGQTAAAIVEEAQHTKIFGHIHRQELASKTLWGRDGSRTVSAFSPGCMCHVDGRVPGKKEKQNWKQGLGVIDFAEQGHTIYPVSINDGVAIFDGQVFEARDRLDEIREATEWEHL